ncbi:hypothetical protein [Nocardia sp. CA-290969]|uniref:hypothetical protein n=1 Tax=Nocardia sp. CA-290969 TaxID=3239986 RepID=UPI003D922A35
MEPLPVRLPNVAGPILARDEVMLSTLRCRPDCSEYRELLERTRDGLLALDSHADAKREPTHEDSERLQREIDGVIARWKAQHRAVRRAG